MLILSILGPRTLPVLSCIALTHVRHSYTLDTITSIIANDVTTGGRSSSVVNSACSSNPNFDPFPMMD